MIPLDDWMILNKEEAKKDTGLIVPDSVKDKHIVDVGDVFIPTKLGPEVKGRVKVGDRCVFYGLGSVAPLKLPSGKLVYTGKAEDVKWILEEGE